jgi:hypothetical protein
MTAAVVVAGRIVGDSDRAGGFSPPGCMHPARLRTIRRTRPLTITGDLIACFTGSKLYNRLFLVQDPLPKKSHDRIPVESYGNPGPPGTGQPAVR